MGDGLAKASSNGVLATRKMLAGIADHDDQGTSRFLAWTEPKGLRLPASKSVHLFRLASDGP